MATEKKYRVLRPQGVRLWAGKFAAGDTVFEPWLNGAAAQLVRRGHLVADGEGECSLYPPAAEDADADGEGGEMLAVLTADAVAEHTVKDVVSYAAAHPGEVPALLAAAQGEAKPRVRLIAALTELLPASAGGVA